MANSIYAHTGVGAVQRAIREGRVMARALPPHSGKNLITTRSQLRSMLASNEHLVMVKIPAGTAIVGYRHTPQPSLTPISSLVHGFPNLAKPEDEIRMVKDVWLGMTPLTFGHLFYYLNGARPGVKEIKRLARQVDDGLEIYRPESRFGTFVEKELANLPPDIFMRLPAFNVSYKLALEIASWLSGHIPSLEEWQKACRGTEGNRYCWGNSRRVPQEIDTDINGKRWEYRLPGVSYVGPGTVNRPGVFGTAGPFGVLDMMGGVNEWVSRTEFHQYSGSRPASFLVLEDRGGLPVQPFELRAMIKGRSSSGIAERAYQVACGGIDWYSKDLFGPVESAAEYTLVADGQVPHDLRNGVRLAWSSAKF